MNLLGVVPWPLEFVGFGAMDVTKPYEFVGFGAVDVTKPNELGFSQVLFGRSRGLIRKRIQGLIRESKGGRGAPFAQLREIMGAYKKTFPRPYQRRVKGAGAHLLRISGT